MRKLTAMVVASTLALSSASFAFAAETTPATGAPAQTQGAMEHHKGPRHYNPFAGLNLTEQQRTQMKALWKESGPRHDRGDMKKQMDTLHGLVASDTFDQAKVKAEIDKISQEQSARMLERATMENKMYNLLTPAQKKQFNENYQKRAEKMAEHHREHKADADKPAA
ncbi:ATP-independent periplasmic protein-refolding chaperone Spy [Rouxiella badensis]|jgi:protein CpxP|uniref:ATP-independent periplasmic protein-refolding chaperone n=1 Tax=Rouxiella badensis TaxID=1646377 RepID=A0A1X0W9F4_9GAMM|nr:ATP-independent periplasmic protein-refolding chaperone Spy [Rouxiella badensis]MCC3718000.1 ATP-independent periplasmic protein-refolding chaperone Spy [Rouxiella badensis]MCC3729985.1 ATP-independent periplasmic protein-refolding chaperone Spy [Rouxiella badensis]MCC3734242.1 ATP-independent periplasmic protein-refolding chaperone Spy [Rouxiella badensis]MCC3739279.1 ATP-independent periplasmic protein-refolding chaperone Spy [Rouxiella badensis]MCC3747235.1 ATP-independent periplasmic pr